MTAHLFLVLRGMQAQLSVPLPRAPISYQGYWCCSGVGLPCHGQQNAKQWSGELWASCMKRVCLGDEYKAAHSLWLVAAVPDTGPSPTGNLGMFPELVPSCNACQHPALVASRGPGWSWGSGKAQRGKLRLHHLMPISTLWLL